MLAWGLCGKSLGFDMRYQNDTRGLDAAEVSRWGVIKDEYPHCPLLLTELVSIKAKCGPASYGFKGFHAVCVCAVP